MKKIGFLAVILFSLIFSSCSGIMGYSILLWNDEENAIADGTIVPVYLKSNISQVYVIENPETKKKIEIPLWKLSEPLSKSKAKKASAKYEKYSHTYAKCVLDGLPIRADKINTSKQVYRLRKNEIVRTLYEGQGAIPTNGKTNLEGVWLKVLTSNGTQGWCFSYNLRLFQINADGTYGDGAQEAEIQEKDTLLEHIVSTKWYPEYYPTMISSKKIEEEYFKPEYGFDTGYESEVVSLKLPSISVQFDFTSIIKTDEREYKFDNIPIQLISRNSKTLVVKYTDERGMPKSYNFVSLPEDINLEELIQNAKDAKNELYENIRKEGPAFKSSNYGLLEFQENNNFTWSGFMRLVPNVIPRTAKGIGTVESAYYLGADLKASWDGVLSFTFEGTDKPVNLLYKLEENGMRMTQAQITKSQPDMNGRSKTSISIPSNSIVMFFSK